jgi:hypothetical protein
MPRKRIGPRNIESRVAPPAQNAATALKHGQVIANVMKKNFSSA